MPTEGGVREWRRVEGASSVIMEKHGLIMETVETVSFYINVSPDRGCLFTDITVPIPKKSK